MYFVRPCVLKFFGLGPFHLFKLRWYSKPEAILATVILTTYRSSAWSISVRSLCVDHDLFTCTLNFSNISSEKLEDMTGIVRLSSERYIFTVSAV